MEIAEKFAPLKEKLQAMTAKYESSVAAVTADKNAEYIDFHARRLVEIAGHIIMGYLLLADATRNDSFSTSAEVYIRYGEAEVEKNSSFIASFSPADMGSYMKK